MILAALVAASLVLPASIDRGALLSPSRGLALSLPQKRAAIQPLVASATECIARTVSGDPRFDVADAVAVNDLIVDSMPSCIDAVRRMIDAYDRLFGEGAGESFFMGPYLDGLPAAVHTLVNGPR
jgi:hypothetical protein